MSNNSLTKLDYTTAIRSSFDESNQSLRISHAADTAFDIQIDKDSDSVTAYPPLCNVSASNVGSNISDIVIDAFDITMIRNICLYIRTNETIMDEQLLTLEVSPLPFGDFWLPTEITITPTTIQHSMIKTDIAQVCAYRARIRTAAAINSGSYNLIVIGN